MAKTKGWRNKNNTGNSARHESKRHGFASRGIKTKVQRQTAGMIRTEIEWKLVVPANDNDERPISARARREIARAMSERFKGLTTNKSSGLFVSKSGKVDSDNSVTFSSIRDIKPSQRKDAKKINAGDRKFMRDLARRTGVKFGQEEVLLVENVIRDGTFVKGERKKRVPDGLIEKEIIS